MKIEETGGVPIVRPRFSVRTLTILVTVVCAYFGAWKATTRYGAQAVNEFEFAKYGELYIRMRSDPASARVPLIIVTGFSTTTQNTVTDKTTYEPVARRYYLWLGKVIPLGEWHRSQPKHF